MSLGLTLIEKSVPVEGLLAELEAHPGLWREYTYRSDAPLTPHAKVADIWLRYNDLNNYAPSQMAEMMAEHDSQWYAAIDKLPTFKAVIQMLMSSLQGERLGGVLISKLPPGCAIAAHVDDEWHSLYYKKFHLVLSGKGSAIYSGHEFLVNEPGDLFHLDSSQAHGVLNLGEEDRIVLIVCIRQDSGYRVKKVN